MSRVPERLESQSRSTESLAEGMQALGQQRVKAEPAEMSQEEIQQRLQDQLLGFGS